MYNPCPTVATGDLWTASNHNTYIRDNFAAGVPGAFTAAGQMVYASGVQAAAILAAPQAGQVLGYNAGVPGWKLPLTVFLPPLGGYPGSLYTYGTVTVTANTWNSNIPATAKALLMSISCQSTVQYLSVNVGPTGHVNVNSRCLRAVLDNSNMYHDRMGLVPLVNGQFDVNVANGNIGDQANVMITVWGYL